VLGTAASALRARPTSISWYIPRVRSDRAITVVGCHAGGEIGNVVVGGVIAPPGQTVFERMQALRADD